MMIFFQKIVGISITDNTVEVVALMRRAGKPKVVGLARAILLPGIVENGRVKDNKKLTVIIKRLFSEAKPQAIDSKHIYFALPDNVVYLHNFIIEPYHKKDNIEDLIVQEAKRKIPLPAEDLLYSYKVLTIENKQGSILLAGASKQIIIEWQQFFKDMDIEIEDFDIKTLANFRNLFSKRPKKAVCLVDLGARYTNLSIFDKYGLRYTHSINFAGNKITSRVAKALGITKEEAEKRKIKYGLVTRNNKMFTSLAKSINHIFKQVLRILKYYNFKYQNKVSQIVLLGGTSQLKGLIDYLQNNLKLSVDLGSPKLIKESISLEYVSALGAALRALNRKWNKYDPVIHYSLEEQEKEEKEKEKKAKQAAQERKHSKNYKNNKPRIIKEETLIDFEKTNERGAAEEISMNLGENIENSEKKVLYQKIFLIVLIVVGIAGVFFAYHFRAQEKAQKAEADKKKAEEQLNKLQTIPISILISITPNADKKKYIQGHIINDIVRFAGDYHEALAHSTNNIQKKLEPGEVIWKQPINHGKDETNISFPITFKWLAYNQKDASKMLLNEIDKLNTKQVDYALNKIEKDNLVATKDEGVFELKAKITITVNQLIKTVENKNKKTINKEDNKENKEGEKTTTEKNTSELSSEFVTIADTGLGWLNARQGPGTSYKVVKKLLTGDKFALLEEKDGWSKLDLGTEGEVWVLSKYLLPAK